MQYPDVTLESVIEHLRLKGMRVTMPRRAMIEFLMETDMHPTVEEIYEYMCHHYNGISLATVYNNVNFLVEEGLLHEMTFAQGKSRYDFLGNRHCHIICEQCHRIADFHTDAIQVINQAAQDQTGYHIQRTNVELVGLCPSCQAKQTS